MIIPTTQSGTAFYSQSNLTKIALETLTNKTFWCVWFFSKSLWLL